MAKGKKGKGKGKGKGKAKGKKGTAKKQVPAKTQLEIVLAAQMKKRINKTPRPLPVLQANLKKLLEHCDRRGKPRPIFKIAIPNIAVEDHLQELGAPAKQGRLIDKIIDDSLMSPIDIPTGQVLNCKYQRLRTQGLFDRLRQTSIYNTGSTVEGKFQGSAFISEGPLFGSYKLANFHLHYGESRMDGTEHTINGRRYTLELQIEFVPCHWEECSPEIEEIRSTKAIIALLFKLSKEQSYYELFSLLSHVSEKGNKIDVASNLLCDFKEVITSAEYYNYVGYSCNDCIEWMVFKNILPIQKSQMKNLWLLRMGKGVEKANIKPIKPIGNRKIFSPVYQDHLQCRGEPVCRCNCKEIPSVQTKKINKCLLSEREMKHN